MMRDLKGRHLISAALVAGAAAIIWFGGGQISDWRHQAKRLSKTALSNAWYMAEDSLGLDLNHPHWQSPRQHWPGATPESVGLSRARLDALQANLAARNTHAFLVVRDGRLVYEWYSRDKGPNTVIGVASLAKAIVGGPLLLAAMSDGRVSLHDPVSKYVPAWRDDPSKSRITLFELATHSSGLEDVYWGTREADSRLKGWKRRYTDNRDERFRMAIEIAPVTFTPGSRYSYSGVGYQALAYALTKSLAGTAHPNLRAYFRARIAEPLGIPDTDWWLNYGKVTRGTPTELYSIGSGAGFTARAVARIGQLMLDLGNANGRSLIVPKYVEEALDDAGLPRTTGGDGKPAPSIGIAWWVNDPRVFPSLPVDAAIGAGAYHQILLVVPSLRLVAVRLGGPLGSDHWGGRFWTELEQLFFRPLMAAKNAEPDRRSLISETEIQRR